MRLLVTGATGFTGSYVIPLLLEKHWRIRCLVRSTSDISSLPRADIEIVRGNLDNPQSLEDVFRGVDQVLNIASLGFGHAPAIVRTAESAGVKRGIFISTTAIFTSLNPPSKAVRLEAEKTIETSDIEWTILRPTMIYGSSRDRNMSRLVRFLRRSPIIPVFGAGGHFQQPLYVGDLAWAIVAALTSPNTIRKSYNISGADALTFNQVVDTVSQLLNRKVLKWHLPVAPIVSVLKGFDHLPFRLPITAEQVLRLNEDKKFDHGAALQDFGYRPKRFRQGMILELQEMGLLPNDPAPRSRE